MTITVFNLINYLKNRLDTDSNLKDVVVSGEISNFKVYNSGHAYFTLKDERAQIDCVMFKSNYSKLDFIPKDGDKVLLSGNVSIYESSGRLQLYVTFIKLDGLGLLFQKYEELKNKLDKEGYFLQEHKKQLSSKFLNKIAILCGDKSAAMSDIKTCFNRRWPLVQTDYYPVLVQGEDAAINIIETLILVDSKDYDAIILSRGGGSFEDLFCFNDENLVKTIYNLKTFIITGVGHEKDFTLVDFVADLRAPTPTAAVELITPDINKIREEIINLNNSLNSNIKNIINKYYMKLDYLKEKLNSFQKITIRLKSEIDNLITKSTYLIRTKIINKKNYIHSINLEMKNKVNNKLFERHLLLKRLNALLKAYSSDNILKKGYSVIYKDQRLIKTINDVEIDDLLNIKLYDGVLSANVKEKYGK